ncbi:unnamed protein product, partial [Brenthis ino]
MLRYTYTLFCILCVLFNSDVISSKRISGRHSYPKSGGLSGGGSHSYPSSGGLSGGGHGYPSSGGSHGYPSSGGLSGGGHGYPSSGGSHTYPSSGGSHNYPTNTNTGSHGYPAGKGLSGNSPSHAGASTTNVHYHYNYNPPQQIRYTPTHGGPPVSYPVYHGTPPTYVYKYKDSGSKYGTLLTGLALLNLGTLGVAAYSLGKGHSNSEYKPQPGEVCKFGIKKDNGDYEETRIECNLISSFIYQEEANRSHNSGTNATVVTTTVTNVTTVNTNGVDHPPSPVNANPLYEMLPNGTLVPVNSTLVNTTAISNNMTSNGGMTSVVTISTTNTTTVNAIDVKGKPIDVTPGMQCYVIRHSPSSNMKKAVPCGLLQSYANQSLKRNSAMRNVPIISIFAVVLAMCVA